MSRILLLTTASVSAFVYNKVEPVPSLKGNEGCKSFKIVGKFFFKVSKGSSDNIPTPSITFFSELYAALLSASSIASIDLNLLKCVVKPNNVALSIAFVSGMYSL